MNPKDRNSQFLSRLGVDQDDATAAAGFPLGQSNAQFAAPLGPDSPVVVLTVVEAASIIECEGVEPSYRYDLPAAGIRDGWAIDALWQQCADSAQCERAELRVELIAPEDIAKVLAISAAQEHIELLAPGAKAPHSPADTAARQGNTGQGSAALEESQDVDAQVLATQELPATNTRLRRPSATATGQKPLASRAVVLSSIGLITAVIIAGCYWFLLRPQSVPSDITAANEALSAQETSTQATSTALSSAPAPPGTAPPNTPQPSAPPTSTAAGAETTATLPGALAYETFDAPELSVALPSDFAFYENAAGGIIRYAQDPEQNLRIHFAKDPVDAGHSPAEMQAMMAAYIETDDQLEHIEPTSKREGLYYLEIAEDGSHTQWLVFSDAHNIYSVGCQTRQALSASQQEICKVAQESVVFH